MIVVKRDGNKVEFNGQKIVDAISKAGFVDDVIKRQIADEIAMEAEEFGGSITVEQIQDSVERKLMASNYKQVAREYIRYRYKRELIRRNNQLQRNILEIVAAKNDYVNGENSNKNPQILSTQRDYMAGEVSKDLSMKMLLPDEIVEAHQKGIIHFHDSDYFAQTMHNCCLVNLEDMLQNGTVISKTLIEKPHSFATACNVATQIMAQVASNQYGGQSVTLSHLAPFVDISRKKIRSEVKAEWDLFLKNGVKDNTDNGTLSKQLEEVVEKRVRDEVKRGVQTIQYQVNTLMTTNGQTPFVTVFLYLNEVPKGRMRDDLALIIEEVLKQRYQGTKNEKGVWVTPAFPKLVYVTSENNIHEDSKYWYLTELAAKCTARRLVPDYVSEKMCKKFKVTKDGVGHCYPPMGCRSFLTPYMDEQNHYKFYGRFNQGVVTINLPDVALTAIREAKSKNTDVYDEFWSVFENRLELCHRGLQQRHQRLKGTLSDVSPIHWQYGALARLKKGEKIDKLLYGGYSTISLGYAGLYECVKAITGKSHTDESAKPFAMAIMNKLNAKCNEWKEAENIAYSLYGTPIESTTEKFARCLQKRFGIIKDVTDHDYITNSYHVNVREKIDPFKKLDFEAEFQQLSPGGAISYIETGHLDDNIPAVLEVIKYMYDHILYAELNTKSDYCHECGYNGDIAIYTTEQGRLGWKCPQCGNTDQNKMNVARRTCGYIGANFWAQGRTAEIKDRFVHLGGNGFSSEG